jgi:hypothetical protein
MKFFSDIRLLFLAIWLGAAIFFVGAAQVVFRIVQPEQAGAIVRQNLTILNYAGQGVAILLLVTSFVGAARISRFWLWIERFMLLLLGAACAVGQFAIGFWMDSLLTQMGRPVGEVAADDPLRIQFNQVHQYSEWILLTAMAAALIVFFIISNRKFTAAAPKEADVYDFSKEFKT